jgi:DNA (cytosine-5)-methyltransferase 1
VKAVSLFAGIGGFDLALERNGIEVVASVEWDKHAQSVLKNRFPNSQIYGDIQEVTGEQLINAGFDPRNGIITGGFPCQDLSVAGKRAGLAGNRSGLFWEICRLLDETKTQYFILENVPGLLSSNGGADMGVVMSALAQRGYGLAYRVLDAQYFGVPQRRRRVFIVGSLRDNGGTPAEILAIAEGRAGYLAQGGKTRKSSTTASNESVALSSGKDVTNCLPASLYHHGTVVNQDVDSGHLVLSQEPTPFSPSSFANYSENDDVSATLRAGGGDLGGGSETLLVFDPHQEGPRIQGNTVNTLTASMGTGGNNVPMVAYPMHGAMVGRNDEAGPKGSGFFGENEPSYTLTASSQARHGVVIAFDTYNHTTADTNQTLRAGTDVDKQGAVLQNSMVRRLTPLECERLQGFPDHWTEGQTDGHRYKQLGNAVAVPVVQWIIERLVKVVGETQ